MQADFFTPPQTSIKWLFLDLNSYFASVEQQHNPALRGKPVAVVPMATDGTCAIAASREAKKYGIKTGTKIYDAKRMCPDLICVLAKHDLYVQYHHRILDEVIKHTPINKVWSIDELSSRLPPNKQTREAATGVALRLKEGLRQNLGEYITCSIGLAPNGFLGKVGSDMQKPNGLVILEPATMAERLFKLKLTDLPGINVNMEARLNKAGIRTIEQFWNISPKHARKIWGSVAGERFWYNLHGHEVPDLETNRSMVGHSRILDYELRSPEQARLVARRLTIKAATRLRRMEMYATSFDLSVREHKGEGRWSAGIDIPPSQDNFSFLGALDELWAAMRSTLKPWQLKKVSVTMTGLCTRQDITPDLFDSTSPARQKLSARNEKLSGMMDHLNKKFGSETIRLGVSPQTSAGFVGTKIAFNRIPDQAEFSE
jgi:DNA polymerase-4